MDMDQVNVWAILAATAAAFVIGGLWYSPVLFGKVWMRVNGFRDEDLAKGGQAKIFGLAFVLTLVMAANLAIFLADAKTNTAWGATAGFLAGFGWVAMGLAVIALFERRSWKYVLVNGGYMVVAFVVMGTILGMWR